MKKTLALLFVFILSSAVFAEIYVNGKKTNIEMIDQGGVIYAPIKSLSKALSVSYAEDSAGNIKLSTGMAGGANQIKGVEGTMGETLFNGITRFTVTGFDVVEVDPFGSKPLSNGKFALVSVEVRNGSKKARYYGYGGHKMTLIDDKGQIFTSDAMKQNDNWIYGVGITELVPGGFLKGKYVFEIPTSSTPQRIVFEPRTEKNEPAIRVKLTKE